MAISGVALGSIAVGSLLVFAGIKGYSIPATVQDVITGKSPLKQNQVTAISTSAGTDVGSSGSSGSLPSVGPSISQTQWADAILKGLGAPTSNANVMSLVAWSQKESPWNASPPDGAEYTHNPLNTTLESAGVVGSVNSIGVKVYDNWNDGNSATVTTLNGYPSIVAALQSGQGLCGNPNIAGDLLKWSGGGYSSVC